MSTRNEIRRKVLDIMQRGNMRRIAYMHGYVFPAFHDVVRTFQKRRKKLHETGSNRFEPVHTGSVPRHVSESAS